MVHVKIIRHSERLDFSNPFYWLLCFGHYWADSPLTTNGHLMANNKGKELLTNNFNPSHIFTSPYTRTITTATEIQYSFPQSQLIIEPLLSEYQPNYKHTISLYPKGIPTLFNGKPSNFSFPETYDSFKKRIYFVIYNLISKYKNDMIIITHGEVLKTFINYIQDLYPDLILDPGNTPYLTTLSFDIDITNNEIMYDTVKINF